LYCLGIERGLETPAESTSREKSSSSLSKLCSIALLIAIQSSTLTPLSPSIMTAILLSEQCQDQSKTNDYDLLMLHLTIGLLFLSLNFGYKKRGLAVPSFFHPNFCANIVLYLKLKNLSRAHYFFVSSCEKILLILIYSL